MGKDLKKGSSVKSKISPADGKPILYEVPPIDVIVEAKCQRANGSIETHRIRRITAKDTSKGWQWSHAEIRTYFTLKVLEWHFI